jgi:predicted Zn-dependent peptidase
MDNRMGRIAQQEFYTGQYRTTEAALDAIKKITLRGVWEASQELLDASNMHQVTVGP